MKGERADDTRRCRWPNCDCYSPQGPQSCRRARMKTLTMTLNGQRHVFAAIVPSGKDPMEMTLGEWQAAPALSAVALCNDFFARIRPLPEDTGRE